MTNNDILRRIRYIFDYSDAQMVALFNAGGIELNKEGVLLFLEKDEDKVEMLSDRKLAGFLNGFISDKRGQREGGIPQPEERLNNNTILRKLKIALTLQDTDIVDILHLAGLRVSKHEINAFFRKKDHKNYRSCRDQVLRNFLTGLQVKYRGDIDSAPHSIWT